jgi:glutathionyl-hydroquinone reductase
MSEFNPINYCLILAKTCPYAHRIEIVRLLKGLDEIEICYCDPVFKFAGWDIDYEYQGSVNLAKKLNINNINQLYKLDNENFNGRATIPILLDKRTNTIISNESDQIIKILNGLNGSDFDLYPDILKHVIDAFCVDFNNEICTGTYKAGHAKTIEEYQKYYNSVFEYLDKLDKYIATNNTIFIINNMITLADAHVFAHLIRFDPVFYTLFSLNGKHLWQYENIKKYLGRLYRIDAFIKSTDLDEIKKAYLCENNLPNNLGYIKIPLGNGGIEEFFCSKI